jgi:hypothetical protein
MNRQTIWITISVMLRKIQYIFTYILQWNKFDNWDSGACIGQQIGKVCRGQKGYRKSYIEEGQAIQIFCTIRLVDHRTKPGTAIQCKTKDSSCHRQSSVRVLSRILAAQSSVFCIVFYRPPLHEEGI